MGTETLLKMIDFTRILKRSLISATPRTMRKIRYLIAVGLSFSFIHSTILPPLLVGPEDIFYQPTLPGEEKRKKESTPTRWGGNSLTQTEKIFQGFPMTVFILGGGAWIFHNSVKLSSSEIEIVGEDAIRADLKGRVLVEDKENGSVLSASKGFYDKLSDKVVLEGRPRLVYTSTDKKKTHISAERIVRYLEEGRSVLEGKVYIQSEDYYLVGEDAVYYENTKRMEISGRPFLFSEERFLSGEKLVYNTESGEVGLEGNAFLIQKSWENEDGDDSGSQPKFAKKKKESKPESTKPGKTSTSSVDAGSASKGSVKSDGSGGPQKVQRTTYSFADRMIRSTKGENPYTGLLGNAQILREDGEFHANSIRSLGKNNEVVEARGSVRMVDLENSTVITGEFLEHFQEKKYSHVTGSPKIEVWNKDMTEVTTTITCVELERFEDRREMVTRGDVVIQSQTSIARGEYSTYFEEQEKIVLEGDPSLERDGKNLHSGKIIIYPQEDRVILSEGLNLKGAE